MRIPLLFLLLTAPSLAQHVHHTLTVEVFPETQSIQVHDAIQLPAEWEANFEGSVNIHPDLFPMRLAMEKSLVTVESDTNPKANFGWPEGGYLEMTYGGRLHQDLSDESEEYTRGFRLTEGTIQELGVYLAGESRWIPRFGDEMITFDLTVIAPDSWHVISQGEGSSTAPGPPEGKSKAHWVSRAPMEQIYLVGGPLRRYQSKSGSTTTEVYLHADEPGLSNKYLTTTDRYLRMYQDLLGPYPYAKFALVENFWETGFGMPSFTLLGEQVIRMPFILHSSYPHEILHNWWGNSVFVDASEGNWCEGLTAYMADHLVQEQRGKGFEYRRNTLQKYRDYVREGRDFPLREFQSRHDSATEAVGYGKSLMLFHMLRQQFGDAVFLDGVRDFYQQNKGERAGFPAFRESFERKIGSPLEDWFAQWLERTGAPELEMTNAQVLETDKGFEVSVEFAQTQDGEPYELLVPVAIQTERGTERFSVPMHSKEARFQRVVENRPLSLSIDPDFDLFRVLDPLETPPTIGQLFGDPSILAVLPSSDETQTAMFRELLTGWQTDNHAIKFVLDKDLQALPADQSVWLLGFNNQWSERMLVASQGMRWSDTMGELQFGAEMVPQANHSFVNLWPNAANPEKVIGLLTLHGPAALDGMRRKLPHYGKYSYLAFEGDEPTNVLKGQWPTSGSPLTRDLRGDTTLPLPGPQRAERSALASLPPEFLAERLTEHVRYLADPAMEGRGLGSAALERSAEYIAAQMEAAGLQPAGDDGTWYQEFEVQKGPEGKPVTAKNVVGILPGTRWPEQSFLIGAHYDHLGRGWPEAHSEFAGQVHPGADDNASGVSVMLEVARNLVAEGAGSRSLVVVAFGAEEAGLVSSRHYVKNPHLPLTGLRGVINLDSVGRLQPGGKVSVHASGTADEWQHIFRGVTFETGIQCKLVPDMLEGSDQLSFIEKGVPAVQLFTGVHTDYHRPGDTIDKVLPEGMVQVATLTKIATRYMLDREEPLKITIEGSKMPSKEAGAGAPGGARRVSFGSIPDYSFPGPGVKLEGVSKDSPAKTAGLQAGDILLSIAGTEVYTVREFSQVLKTLKPDQTIEVLFERDGKEQTVEVTVRAR